MGTGLEEGGGTRADPGFPGLSGNTCSGVSEQAGSAPGKTDPENKWDGRPTGLGALRPWPQPFPLLTGLFLFQ